MVRANARNFLVSRNGIRQKKIASASYEENMMRAMLIQAVNDVICDSDHVIELRLGFLQWVLVLSVRPIRQACIPS